MDTLRLAKKNFPLIGALAALFFLVTVLSVTTIRSETSRNTLIMESIASRTASLLLEIYFEQGVTEDPKLAVDVVGFGVYSDLGTPVVRYGSAPEDVRSLPTLATGELYERNRERGTLVHVRTIATPGSGLLRWPQLLAELTSRYLYLEIDVGRYLRRQAFYNAALATAPLVIAALTVLAGYYALKIAQYREQMTAQERLARLGEAARTLAHELKNPLNVIRLRARLARRNAPAEAAADLDVVEQEVDRLAELTGRIRDFLQDAAGRPEVVELGEFTRELASRSGWDAAIEQGGSYPVRFDRDRLRTVIENLVQNARESSPPDGLHAIELRLRRDRSFVILSVLDRGCGIDPADRDRVFDPFYTTKITGSGIGLSITRRFVEAAGGKVELLSREGGGTEARVTLAAAGERSDR